MTAITPRRTAGATARTPLQAGGPDTVSESWEQRYSRLLLSADFVAIVGAVSLAQFIRFGDTQSSAYSKVSVAIAVLWVAALTLNRSRSPGVIGEGAEEYRRVFAGTTAVFGTIAIVSLVFKFDIARGYLLVALPVGTTLLLVVRWGARQIVIRLRRQHGYCITRVLVVGAVPDVRDLTTALTRESWSPYKIVGACVPRNSVLTGGVDVPGAVSVPILGDESSVIEAMTVTGCDAVAVTTTDQLDSRRIRELSWELERFNVELLLAPGVVDVAGPRLHMRPVSGLPLIHVEKPQYHGAQRFQKRLFDVCFSGLVLLCGLPLLLAIAVAIKLTSKGPVLYRQERVGLDGEPFEIVKFRTMVDGAENMLGELAHLNESGTGGVLFKIQRDPRVTAVGRVLRKYSLDELPQFINVLRHEMSVVGPRPPLATEVETYDDFAMRRLLVRPGITGLWQVSGRADLSWEDSVRLDLFYVENWSMMADVVIAVKTVRAVLSHSGAY